MDELSRSMEELHVADDALKRIKLVTDKFSVIEQRRRMMALTSIRGVLREAWNSIPDRVRGLHSRIPVVRIRCLLTDPRIDLIFRGGMVTIVVRGTYLNSTGYERTEEVRVQGIVGEIPRLLKAALDQHIACTLRNI